MTSEQAVYDVVGAFQDIEMSLIESMSHNMKRHIGEEYDEEINWTQWQAEMLNGLAEYKAENSKMLPNYYSLINDKIEETIMQAYATGESEQEIEILRAIQEGYKPRVVGKGADAMQGAFFRINANKLNALITATTNDMKRAESAILRLADDAYRQTIFKAQMYYNSGASTLWKAVDMATKNFLSAGINCVQYKNGARVNIASYSEMALRTANKRANLMGSASKREEYGIHTVKISSHNSACPICIQWQGQVYIDDVYGGGTAAESKSAGYPLLSTAVAGGMFHPNCKNGCSTYYEGISQKPKKTTDEQAEEMTRRYDLEQKQRYCERNIRKYDRLSMGSIDADDVAKYKSKSAEWRREYNKLIANNPDVLRDNPARLKLYGIGSSSKSGAIDLNRASQGLTSALDAKNFSELQKYMAGLNMPMDDSISSLCFDVVRQSTAGVENVMREFPNATSAFTRFGTRNSGVMCANASGQINFNPAYYKDAKRLESMKYGNVTGFHPKNSNIITTGSHEAGHILELALIKNNSNGSRITEIVEWNKGTQANNIVSEACKRAKKTPEGKGKINNTLKQEISGYALKNSSECLAEAVNDYMANGENASTLSKMIWQCLKEVL